MDDGSIVILTDEQIDLLNRARTTLREVARRAWYDAPESTSQLTLGRFAEAMERAEAGIFQALNVTNAYGVQTLTDDQLHNRS